MHTNNKKKQRLKREVAQMYGVYVYNIFQPPTAVHLVVCNAPGTICYGVSTSSRKSIYQF